MFFSECRKFNLLHVEVGSWFKEISTTRAGEYSLITENQGFEEFSTHKWRLIKYFQRYIYYINYQFFVLLGEACDDGKHEEHVGDERSLHPLRCSYPCYVRQGADKLYK